MKTTTCYVKRDGVTHHIPVLDTGNKCYFCGNAVVLEFVNTCNNESEASFAPFFWSAKCASCFARYGAIRQSDTQTIDGLVFRSTLSTTCGSEDLPDYVMAGTTRVRSWLKCLVCHAKVADASTNATERIACKCGVTTHQTSDDVAAPTSSKPRTDAAYNHPLHYGGDTTYEAIKVINAWGLGFALGNAVKYIARAGLKDPRKLVEDLEKARWYLDEALRHAKLGERRVLRVGLEDEVPPSPPESNE